MIEANQPRASSVIKVLPTLNDSVDCVLINHDYGQLRGRSSSLSLVGDDTSEVIESILAANIEILDFHISAQGDYWACDERGNVYTTAAIDLPSEALIGEALTSKALAADIEIVTAEQLDWQAVNICDKPLVLIWTLQERFIWAMTADGKAFMLDIELDRWKTYDVPCDPIAIAGRSILDLYLITANSEIRRFIGIRWCPVYLPETGLPLVVFTDILPVDEHHYLITAKNGLLLMGNGKDGFNILDAPVLEYFGVTFLNGRYFFAAGSDGIYDCDTLQEPLQLNKLKDARGPLSIVSCANRLNITISEQHQQARFVTLLPAKQLGAVEQYFTTYLN